MSFIEVVEQASAILRRHGRLSYRALQLELNLDDAILAALRHELTLVRAIARDENDTVIVWMGPPEPARSSTDPRGQAIRQSERRQLTVLFCDLVSSTTISASLDAEDLRDIIRDYRNACAVAIGRHSGIIAQWTGDGMDAYFGYPTAHENDATLAIEAGRDILGIISELAAPIEIEHGIHLAVRIGIHTGSVVVGHLEGDANPVLAVGETPNVCARIQTLAVPGTIAISETTERLVRGLYELQSLGPQTLKGIARPMSLYRVVAPRKARWRLDGAVEEGLTPLVDRDEERRVLEHLMKTVAGGAGGAGVTLCGEPGIGKSRLVYHVRQQAEAAGWDIVDCRCSPYHQGTALYPLREALRSRFAPLLESVPATVPLAEALEGAEIDQSEAMPLLAGLLELPWPDDAVTRQMTPQRQRQRTLESVVALVRARAASMSILFIVEDLQWIDPSTLEFVQLLVERTANDRVLMLFTRRAEGLSPLSMVGDRKIDELAVDRLSTFDAERLIRAVAGTREVPLALIHRLSSRADGVPLFLEEITKTVLDTDPRSDVADAVPRIETDIPATLYGCVMARLDRLRDVQFVVQLAATIGRQCHYRLLQEVAWSVAAVDETALRHGLRQLVDAQLLAREGEDPESTYMFRHALLQDAASQTLLKATSRTYHQRIAEILVARFPATAEGQPEVVARHYTAAGRAQEAAHHWQRAGVHALQRSANVEAIAHLQMALQMLGTLPQSAERDAQEMALRVLLAVPLTLTRGWASPDVESAYRRAYELSERVGDAPHLFPTVVGLLTYYIVSAQLATAYDMGLRNLGFAERMNDPELLLEATYDRCATSMYMGRFQESMAHAAKVAALYDPPSHHHHVFLYGRDPGAVAMVHDAIASWAVGMPDRALEVGRGAVSLMERWPHPFCHAWAMGGLAAIYEMRGEAAEVRATGERMIIVSSEQGFPNWLAQGLAYTGWAMTVSGEHREGIAKMEEGIRIWRMTGARLITTYLYYLLADGLARAGQTDEALSTLFETFALVEATGDSWWASALHRLHGDILLEHRGDASQAYCAYERALEIARGQNARGLELRAATGVARLWATQGRVADAKHVLAPVLDTFTEGFSTLDVVEARRLLSWLDTGSAEAFPVSARVHG